MRSLKVVKMGTKVNREMKLSYDVSVEKILEAIKGDILQVKASRDHITDGIFIKTEVYS